LSYRQLPDGSFVSPPGVTTQLVKNANGTYKLAERFGSVLAFDANNRIQSLTDIDGNALYSIRCADTMLPSGASVAGILEKDHNFIKVYRE
jgi:hypothetical protein